MRGKHVLGIPVSIRPMNVGNNGQRDGNAYRWNDDYTFLDEVRNDQAGNRRNENKIAPHAGVIQKAHRYPLVCEGSFHESKDSGDDNSHNRCEECREIEFHKSKTSVLDLARTHRDAKPTP